MNAFTGAEARCLGAEKSELPADLFLHHLFLLGFRCLFERKTADDSPFCKWLSFHVQEARWWRGWLAHRLYPPAGAEGPDLENLFGVLRRVMAVDGDHPRGPLLFWKWLAVMVEPTSFRDDYDWYLPVREDSLLVLATLLLIFSLTGASGDSAAVASILRNRVRPVRGLGLRLAMPARHGDRPGTAPQAESGESERHDDLGVYLVSEASGDEADLDALGDDTHLVRRLAVPSMGYLDRERRWIKEKSGPTDEIKVIRVGRIVTVAAAELIRRARDPGRMVQVLPAVFAEDTPPRQVRLTRIETYGDRAHADAQHDY